MRRRPFGSWSTFGMAALVVAAIPYAADAQAWLPGKGEGTVAVVFTNVRSEDHFLPDRRYELGEIDANTILADVTYGITDRIAVTFGVPVVVSRYRGNFPHRPITLDDGTWHTTTQDFRFNVRYNVMRGPLVVTPFIGSDLPSRDYEFFAHAAPGRALKEIAGGVSIAKLFAAQGIIVQGRYGLTFSEGVLDQSRRFSVASIEGGYFLTPSLRLLAMMSARIAHTGIDLYPDSGRVLPFEVFSHHDQISRESFTNVGGWSVLRADRPHGSVRSVHDDGPGTKHTRGEPRSLDRSVVELRPRGRYDAHLEQPPDEVARAVRVREGPQVRRPALI